MKQKSEGRRDLTDLSILNGATDIGRREFASCNSLTDIAIPDSVASIGSRAFDACKGLTRVAIPNSVTSIGTNPFRACGQLQTIWVAPDHPTLEVIDGVLFEKAQKKLICRCV